MAKFWRSYIVQSLLYLLFFLYLYCSVAQCRLGRMLMSSQIVSVFFFCSRGCTLCCIICAEVEIYGQSLISVNPWDGIF